MGPVHRWHAGPITVPVAFLQGLEALYGPDENGLLDEGMIPLDWDDGDENGHWHRCEAAWARLILRGRGRFRHPNAQLVLVDARDLTFVRNYLNDDMTNESGLDEAMHGPWATTPRPCAWFCPYCQLDILDWWCNALLDTLGQPKNAYVGDAGPPEVVAEVWRVASEWPSPGRTAALGRLLPEHYPPKTVAS